MPRTPRRVSRRQLLELAAAAGVASLLPHGAGAGGDEEAESAVLAGADDAELIGLLLWSAFKEGAGIKSIPRDVRAEGRKRSEGPIRKRLEPANGGLEGFPYAETILCAKKAGIAAKKEAGNGPLTAEIFGRAWDGEHHKQEKHVDSLPEKDKLKFMGGAC